MWSGAQRSTLVLGPPRAGKTSSLVIPNILLAPGAVVSTSTKPDVMQATAAARSSKGWTFLYDPSGTIDCPRGVERVGWSPLTSASKWDGAVVTADAMVRASRMGGTHAAEGHWNERAGALLSTLLHAAAVADHSMRDLLRWIDRHDGAPALEILSTGHHEGSTATDLLTGIVATDPREQSGIWSTASGVLAAYRTDGAMESTRAPQLDLSAFCDGTNTLYICSSGRHQRQFAPLVVATLGDVRDAVYARSQEGRPSSATLLALDEVANIAPVPDLPAMVSEGGGQGLLVLACLQDLSQARNRWGTAADGFLSLFGTTVVLPGIADTRTLRDISALGRRARGGLDVDDPHGRPLGRDAGVVLGGDDPDPAPARRRRGPRCLRPRPRPRAAQRRHRGPPDPGPRLLALARDARPVAPERAGPGGDGPGRGP